MILRHGSPPVPTLQRKYEWTTCARAKCAEGWASGRDFNSNTKPTSKLQLPMELNLENSLVLEGKTRHPVYLEALEEAAKDTKDTRSVQTADMIRRTEARVAATFVQSGVFFRVPLDGTSNPSVFCNLKWGDVSAAPAVAAGYQRSFQGGRTNTHVIHEDREEAGERLKNDLESKSHSHVRRASLQSKCCLLPVARTSVSSWKRGRSEHTTSARAGQQTTSAERCVGCTGVGTSARLGTSRCTGSWRKCSAWDAPTVAV